MIARRQQLVIKCSEKSQEGMNIFRLRSQWNDIVPLSYLSDFWNRKVDCSHGSGLLSYQFWDLFTLVRYCIVSKHFAPKQAKENLICQQISNTAE